MAWPKKGTRTISVDGKKFLWHLSGNRLDSKETVITVGHEGQKYVLFIDPYPWDFDIKPSNIVEAVRWALGKGWTPESGPDTHMAYSRDEKGFVWLPEGIRFLHKVGTDERDETGE